MLKESTKLLAGIAIGIIISVIYSGLQVDKTKTRIIDRIVRDTVVEVRQKEPLVIEKTKLKIVTQRDTIIRFKPFKASLDTILRTDSLKLEYLYPENIFSMAMRFRPDTVASESSMIFFHEEKKEGWWEIPAEISGGLAAGLIIGLLIK